jgi:hypothetical protein
MKAKAKKYPKFPEHFSRRVERIRQHVKDDTAMFGIAPLVVSEFEQAIEAYYGGYWGAARNALRKAIYITWGNWTSRIRIGICDRMGWTKLYYYNETDTMLGHWQRHGRKCSGSPNCNNMNCINDSVPRWFKWLTRWEEL